MPPSPEKRDEPLNLSLKSSRSTKAAIWSPAMALEQEEKEESLPSPTGRLSPMDSSDCEAIQATQEHDSEACRDPRAPPFDPIHFRMNLRQYADFVVNLQGLATRDKESEDTVTSRDESLSSSWCPSVWPWAPVYRGSEVLTCQQCPKTFSSALSLEVHMKRSHPDMKKLYDPYQADSEKTISQPPLLTTVTPMRSEKTFQVSHRSKIIQNRCKDLASFI